LGTRGPRSGLRRKPKPGQQLHQGTISVTLAWCAGPARYSVSPGTIPLIPLIRGTVPFFLYESSPPARLLRNLPHTFSLAVSGQRHHLDCPHGPGHSGQTTGRSRAPYRSAPRSGGSFNTRPRVAMGGTSCPTFPPTLLLPIARQEDRLGKDLAMVRILSILALSALCILPDRASADELNGPERVASDISSRQRCACTWRGPIHVSRHRHYRTVRTAYLIGYDPLPYRFGSTWVWEPPYRYYWR